MDRLKRWWTVGLGIVILTGVTMAQEAQNQFVPAESVQHQEIPSGPLLYTAYAFVWAAVLVYAFVLWRRIGRVERELAEVSRKVPTRSS